MIFENSLRRMKMGKNYDDLLNILIRKDVLFLEKHKKKFSKLFENSKALMSFIEKFIKEKQFFLNNIQYTLDTNKEFECLKHIARLHSFYCFRYKKNKTLQNNKNIRCIFFVYQEKIIILEIFHENDNKAYRKGIANAIKTYEDIVKEGD